MYNDDTGSDPVNGDGCLIGKWGGTRLRWDEGQGRGEVRDRRGSEERRGRGGRRGSGRRSEEEGERWQWPGAGRRGGRDRRRHHLVTVASDALPASHIKSG